MLRHVLETSVVVPAQLPRAVPDVEVAPAASSPGCSCSSSRSLNSNQECSPGHVVVDVPCQQGEQSHEGVVVRVSQLQGSRGESEHARQQQSEQGEDANGWVHVCDTQQQTVQGLPGGAHVPTPPQHSSQIGREQGDGGAVLGMDSASAGGEIGRSTDLKTSEPSGAQGREGGAPQQAGWLKKSSGLEGAPGKGTMERPSSGVKECRICLSSDDQDVMVSACACSGTTKWAHFLCLSKWVIEKRSFTCELCNTPYVAPYAELLQQEVSKHPRQASIFNGLQLAPVNNEAISTADHLATAVQSREPRSTAITNPWGRLDFWCCLCILLAALIVILYFTSNKWQVILWGIVVGFVPIIVCLSLAYMLVGRAIETRSSRQAAEQSNQQSGQHMDQAQPREGRERADREHLDVNAHVTQNAPVTFSPFMGIHS